MELMSKQRERLLRLVFLFSGLLLSPSLLTGMPLQFDSDGMLLIENPEPLSPMVTEIPPAYPAADEKAARYRTGIMDELVRNLPFTNVPEMVESLRRDDPDPFLLVKRFHDWITWHVAYDNDAFYGRGEDIATAEEVAGLGRATCGGFADLLGAFCAEVEIPYRKVVGYSRESYDTIRNEMAYHVWGQVFLEGRWYIVDPTHDSRYSVNRNRRGTPGAYRDFYLFPAPEAKIMKNWPVKEEYQLLAEPISFEEFLRYPQLSPASGAYGVSLDLDSSTPLLKWSYSQERSNRYLKTSDLYRAEEGVIQLALDVAPDTLVYPRLYGEDGKLLPLAAEARVEGPGQIVCYFSPPGEGIYSGYISARRGNPYDPKAIRIYEFFLEGDSASRGSVFQSGQAWLTPAARLYGGELLAWERNGDGSVSLTVKTASEVVLFGGLYLPGDIRVKQRGRANRLTGSEESGDGAFGDGGIVYRIEVPPPERPEYQVWVKAKPEGQRNYNDVILVIP